MTLQDFVRDSLVQIVAGVAEAKAKDRRISPSISPTRTSAETFFTGAGDIVSFATFDVAVTVTEKKEGGGSAGISVASILKAEGGGSFASEYSSISRIQFRVPISI
jgi:hypothetical protein